MKILTETSARHIHLCEKDLKKLFGKTKLIPIKKLSQPEQFAAKEIVTLINKNKKLNLRVIGPTRDYSQIEISKTDAIKLKINPPLRLSGHIKNAVKIKVLGPKGNTNIPVIIAKRHIHLSDKEAKKFKLKNKQKVSIKIKGKRGLIFNEVLVRTGKQHKSAFHIDTDEANAAGISNKTFGEIIK